ncbi:MAG: DHH family phosphoesterase [Endomicrobiales bacterium]
MTKERKILSKIAEAIKKNNTFFIAGHIKPDGDTIGSALALASLLRRLGKKPKVYTRETVPQYLCFLRDTKSIILTDRAEGEFDCAIILECSDLDRMGNLISLEQAATVVNIDHHAIFSTYGDINYVEPHASSSAEQVYYLFKHMKMPMTCPEAEALYVGLVTDTGKFQQANTTPEAMRMAADLLEAGIEPQKIYDKLYATMPLSSLNLLGAALSTLKLSSGGRVAYMEITHKMYRDTGSDVTETEGVINYSMMIPGVVVGILFRETEHAGLVKASFRSRGGIDVNKIAGHFGGGGHKNAAGCSFSGGLKSAEKLLLDYLGKKLNK